MFEKCSRCGKRVGKKAEFCSQCGLSLSGNSLNADDGFLGKNDFEDLGIKLPFVVKAMLKPLMKDLQPLMKEFNKQMVDELNKENKKPVNNKNRVVKSFSVHIGSPGQKPMKVGSGMPAKGSKENLLEEGPLDLPKVADKILEKVKAYPRKEPKTNVRRLADNVLYEITLPGVKGIGDINLSVLEEGIEVKAVTKKEVYVKNIDVDLPLKNYDFDDELLVLELGFK